MNKSLIVVFLIAPSAFAQLTFVRPVPLSGVVRVAAGTAHGLAVTSTGRVWAWGSNAGGQLGDGSYTNRPYAVLLRGVSGVVDVAAGVRHSIALASDGSVWTWGDDTYGQLGRSGQWEWPERVYLTDVVAVAAGSLHSLALRADGSVWAWGSNHLEQLGISSNPTYVASTQKDFPVRVYRDGVPLTGASAIGAGNRHSLAIVGELTLSWGANFNGELGRGYSPGGLDGNPAPVEIASSLSPLTNMTTMAGGRSHSLFANTSRMDDTWGTGNGYHGQIGYIGETSRAVKIGNDVTVPGSLAVAAGDCHSMVLLPDGHVATFGCNRFGALGYSVDDWFVHWTPLMVDPDQVYSVGHIAAGSYFSLAVRDADGRVLAWGINDVGELGNGGGNETGVTCTNGGTSPPIPCYTTPTTVKYLSSVSR